MCVNELLRSSQNMALPFEQLPKFWSDPQRLNVLYAPFRSQKTNEKDFHTKYEFWRESIEVYCECNQIFTVNLAQLQTFFTHDGRAPMCLPTVIDEMLRDGCAKTLSDYQATNWGSWASNLVRKTLFGTNIKEQDYVLVNVLKHAAEKLAKTLPPNELMDLEELKLKDSLLLNELKRIDGVTVRNIKNTTFIKYENGQQQGITNNDVDFYMLRKTERFLISSIESLENNNAELLQDVKNYLKKGHKQLAKTSLRKKHDVEKRIESRANALYNVQTLLSRLEDSHHDVHVFNSYQSVLKSLRDNFAENKLNEDAVTNTMLEISETLDIHNEIESTLAQPLNDTDVDLEEELNALLNEDNNVNSTPKPKTKPTDDLSASFNELELPDVPTDDVLLAAERLSL